MTSVRASLELNDEQLSNTHVSIVVFFIEREDILCRAISPDVCGSIGWGVCGKEERTEICRGHGSEGVDGKWRLRKLNVACSGRGNEVVIENVEEVCLRLREGEGEGGVQILQRFCHSLGEVEGCENEVWEREREERRGSERNGCNGQSRIKLWEGERCGIEKMGKGGDEGCDESC